MITEAFKNLVGSDVKLELHGSTYEDVIWLDDRDMPSKEVWQAEFDTLISEIPMNELRAERNAKLAETDWTQSRDVTLSNDAAWQTYRQALRDITDTYSDLDSVVWPTKPE